MSYLLWRTRVSHGVAEAEDEQGDHGGLVQPYEEAGWRGGMVEHAGELLSLTPWLIDHMSTVLKRTLPHPDEHCFSH